MPHRLLSPHGCCSNTAAAGHSLLKKKADALNMRFRQILRKIVETKEEMGKVMKVHLLGPTGVVTELELGTLQQAGEARGMGWPATP